MPAKRAPSKGAMKKPSDRQSPPYADPKPFSKEGRKRMQSFAAPRKAQRAKEANPVFQSPKYGVDPRTVATSSAGDMRTRLSGGRAIQVRKGWAAGATPSKPKKAASTKKTGRMR